MNRGYKIIGLFALVTSLFSGCDFIIPTSTDDGSQLSNTHPTSDDSFSSDTTIPVGGENQDVIPAHNLTYLDLFDLNNKIEMVLDISDNQLFTLEQDLKDNIRADTYRIADSMTISITKNSQTFTFVYHQVGFRMKGNTSRKDEFVNNDTGELHQLIHYKFSFQETFDDPNLYGDDVVEWTSDIERENRKDRTFLGQEKLDARWNKEFDATHIKEYYALEMFRAFGIISQHSNLMHLKMKRSSGDVVNLGVYTFYEAADKEMYKRALQSGDAFINMASWSEEKNGTFGVANSNYGDLYKCSWGANLSQSSSSSIGVEDVDHWYIYDLKTNKDVSQHDSLKNLINTVSNGDYNAIASKVDLEYFAMYEAISYVLGNPDDCRNNKNNYMIYFRKTDGKMIMIPIDQDRVFGITRDWNPYGDGGTSLTPLDKRMVPEAGGNQDGKLYLKTFLANSDNATKSKYLENVEMLFKSQWVTNGHFNTYYEMAKQHYGNREIWETTGALYGKSITWSLNEKNRGTEENYSFADYINLKSQTANFPLDDENPDPDPSLDLKDVDLYLTGPFCDWNPQADDYKFTKNSGQQKFTLTYNHIDKYDNYNSGYVLLKITSGSWEANKYWRFEDGLLTAGDGDNCRIEGLSRNCIINFTITFSGEISWEIHN